MPKPIDAVARVHERVSEKLDEIATYFLDSAKLTLVVRAIPDNSEAELVLTNDSLEEAVGALRRSLGREALAAAPEQLGYCEANLNPAEQPAPEAWGVEEVRNLDEFQRSGAMHPFTCPNRGDDKHFDNGVDLGALVPTVRGWICQCCDYTQSWAHDFMLNGNAVKSHKEMWEGYASTRPAEVQPVRAEQISPEVAAPEARSEKDILHKLRNPYGYSAEQMREVRLAAADLIEQYRDAYLNMRDFAEKSGLDTVARKQ